MALKLPDSAVPMGDFPVAKAVDIDFNDGENLQEKLDNGKLGGAGGGASTYTSLEALGLTAPVSVGEIFNAMPNKTTAVIACEGKEGNTEGVDVHVSDVPISFGVLTIKKNEKGRFSIEYQNSLQGSPCDVKRWIGTLKGEDGTGLYWQEIATMDKLSASLDEKASKEEIKNFKNVHNSPTTLGITIESGQDNTRKVFDALGVGERYHDRWDNSSSISKWGIAESYGNTVQIEIVKVGSAYGACTAITNKGITLQRCIDPSMPKMPDWKELATMDKVWTTEIADVPNTVIVSNNTEAELNSNCYYTVINGVCYVTLWGFTCTKAGRYIVNSSMPKTRLTMSGTCTYGTNGYEGGCAYIYYDGDGNNKLYVEVKITEPLYGSFSYPVAE